MNDLDKLSSLLEKYEHYLDISRSSVSIEIYTEIVKDIKGILEHGNGEDREGRSTSKIQPITSR